jgi:hypothetical protein
MPKDVVGRMVTINLGYIPYHIDFNGKQFFTNPARRIGYLSADSFNSEAKIAFSF